VHELAGLDHLCPLAQSACLSLQSAAFRNEVARDQQLRARFKFSDAVVQHADIGLLVLQFGQARLYKLHELFRRALGLHTAHGGRRGRHVGHVFSDALQSPVCRSWLLVTT
jgi:hypothetical protein